jgi:hypothetical protein
MPARDDDGRLNVAQAHDEVTRVCVDRQVDHFVVQADALQRADGGPALGASRFDIDDDCGHGSLSELAVLL